MRSLVRVDLAAVRANLTRLNEAEQAPVWAVVKADGYGHGALVVARAALAAGALGVAAATIGEAQALRQALPGARVLVLSPIDPGTERDATGLEVAVSSRSGLERLRNAQPGAHVHVKVETGMGRWGFDAEEALVVGRLIEEDPSLRLAGLMSHLATAEEPDTSFVAQQVRRFQATAANFPACPRHLANSAGVLYQPQARFDTARCGIALYGISPRDADPASDGLSPAMTWTSELIGVRHLGADASSGYGRRIRPSHPTRVGLVPVGYADGFPRPAAGAASVLIGGRPARVGAVAMDQLGVILPEDLPAMAGDAVTLIGRDGPARAGIEALARAAGTIGYEIACRLREAPLRSRREVVNA